MPEATDKAAATDEQVMDMVVTVFGDSETAAAHWQSRYDDAARRLARAEAERGAVLEEAAKLREAVQAWLDKQGHERCWYYPDIFNEIARSLGMKAKAPANLPPRDEFDGGCQRYQREEYDAEARP